MCDPVTGEGHPFRQRAEWPQRSGREHW